MCEGMCAFTLYEDIPINSILIFSNIVRLSMNLNLSSNGTHSEFVFDWLNYS